MRSAQAAFAVKLCAGSNAAIAALRLMPARYRTCRMPPAVLSPSGIFPPLSWQTTAAPWMCTRKWPDPAGVSVEPVWLIKPIQFHSPNHAAFLSRTIPQTTRHGFAGKAANLPPPAFALDAAWEPGREAGGYMGITGGVIIQSDPPGRTARRSAMGMRAAGGMKLVRSHRLQAHGTDSRAGLIQKDGHCMRAGAEGIGAVHGLPAPAGT